jgi:hypothetical protein
MQNVQKELVKFCQHNGRADCFSQIKIKTQVDLVEKEFQTLFIINMF